ncbi:hypothetical protein Q6282_29325, partial [Klebsiella pneumoniae]|nr:hypothetical protein [Klebsiella pneumoniae]
AVVIDNIFARMIGSYNASLGDVAAQVLLLQSSDLDLSASGVKPVRSAQTLRVACSARAMRLHQTLDDNGELQEINETPFI